MKDGDRHAAYCPCHLRHRQQNVYIHPYSRARGPAHPAAISLFQVAPLGPNGNGSSEPEEWTARRLFRREASQRRGIPDSQGCGRLVMALRRKWRTTESSARSTLEPMSRGHEPAQLTYNSSAVTYRCDLVFRIRSTSDQLRMSIDIL